MEQGNGTFDLVTVLGHTAGGKTRVAASLAASLDGEVISADSRQVYRRMNLGTGKDYPDYLVDGRLIPCHLIDLLEPGYEYNVFEYQRDFLRAFRDVTGRGKPVVLCGGSGLYIEAVLKGYRLVRVPVNKSLRDELQGESMKELTARLTSFRNLHNTTDTVNRKRLVRAIEIETWYRGHPAEDRDYPALNPLILGISFDRDTRRKRISERLNARLRDGMVDEVEALLKEGVPGSKLIYYGLEYRYITEYLSGNTAYEEMVSGLETAIHRFAKRQMTWFRGMERRGLRIHWLDGMMPPAEKLERALELYRGKPGA